MSAQFVDALKGYEHFLSTRGKTSMAEINTHLEKQGRRRISLRTYGHYAKLLAKGFRSYVPINKFDVFEAVGKIRMAADRRRYGREEVHLKTEVSPDGSTWHPAIITSRSVVGFGLETPVKFSNRPHSSIWIRLPGHSNIPGFVVWRATDGHSTRLGIRALAFVATYLPSPEAVDKIRLKGLLTLHRKDNAPIEWGPFVDLLERLHEAIDAVTALIYAVAEFGKSDIRLARPMLRSIQFSSPGKVDVKVDLGVAEILKVIWDAIRNWGLDRKRFKAETRKIVAEARKSEAEAEKTRIEAANLKIELLRNAIRLRDDAQKAGLIEAIVPALRESLKTILPSATLPAGLLSPGSLESGLLVERVFPAAAELIAGDDPHYDVNASKSAE